MDYASIIKEIGRGTKGARPMAREQAQALFSAMLDGAIPDMELGAILLALRIKGETVEELTGFKAALDTRTAPLAVPDGPRCVILPSYNGARKQANLAPLVALLLARQKIPVLIQGRHDFATRVNPFRLFAALGVPTHTTVAEAEAALANDALACLPLATLAPGLDRILALRQRLGVRNCGHTLAKLLDPCAGRSVRVVALTHPAFIEAMADVLRLEHATALLMRGTEGEPYAAPRRRPRMVGFSQGHATTLFDAAESDDAEVAGQSCEVEANAALISRMLADDIPVPQAILDQVAALRQLACA